jgi:hypothetical protein
MAALLRFQEQGNGILCAIYSGIRLLTQHVSGGESAASVATEDPFRRFFQVADAFQ